MTKEKSCKSRNARETDIARFNFDLANENAEYQAYLNDLLEWSLWESPFVVNAEDELLMLVTCSYYNDDGRFMLVCRKLREGETVEMIHEMLTDN